MIRMTKQSEISVVTIYSEDEEEDFLQVKDSSFDAPTSISSPSATTSPPWDPLEHGHTSSASSPSSTLLLSDDEDLAVLGLGTDLSSYIQDEGELGLTVVEVHTELPKEPDIDKPDPKQQKVIQTKSDDEEFASEAISASAQHQPPQPGKRKACRQRRRATKKFAGNKKQVVGKVFAQEVGVRRNPRRTTAAPADYNENRNSHRGRQLTSEFPIDLCNTYSLQHRVYRNKHGARFEMTNVPESFWPADTLERPTLRDVASQLSTPPEPPVTWGTATHHLLHCVLAMIKRCKSTKNSGFDRVAGKLYYTESLVAQLKLSVKDEGNEKVKIEMVTKETTKEKEKTKKPEPEFVDAGIMLIDLTGDDADQESDLQEDRDWFDELEPYSEAQLCEIVCEVTAMVRDVENRLRGQVAERLLRKLITNISPKVMSRIEFVNVPSLDELEELLERVSFVYRLANRDVTTQGLSNYLASVERKEALRQALREVNNLE